MAYHVPVCVTSFLLHFAVPLPHQPIASTEGVLGTGGREAVKTGAVVPLEHDEILDENVGEREEVEGVDEDLPPSVDEIETVEDNAAVAIDGEKKEKKEAGNQDEDIYMWIEDVRRLVPG